jgi:phosphate transport system substrate-binding protein
MNDEFLHALRRDPPPQFASELKRRLDRQSARRSPTSILRTIAAALLIGSVAMAAALLLRDRGETPRVDVPVARAAVPQAPEHVAQPAGAPRAGEQVASNSSATPQAEAKQSEGKDIPVALITPPLAYPLALALVGRLSKYGYFAQPRVAVSGPRVAVSGYDEGFSSLCGNVDFVIASRRISDAELARCQKWGIDVVEWKLGYQAVVLSAGPASDPMTLTPRDVFLALARRIPDPAEPSRLIDNPNVTWHDVDARLDRRSIEVLLPADESTSAVFLQLVVEAGCQAYFRGWSHQPDPRGYEDVCHRLRSDDYLREVDLSDKLVTQMLSAEPNRLVVLDYAFYAAHRSELRATMLDGPAPTLASLSDGTYPAARPVYVYAQKSHLDWNPAARTLANELTNEDAVGPQGYLRRLGLVPLDDHERRKQREEHSK